MSRMCLQEIFKIMWLARFCKRTTCGQVGQQHLRLRIQNFRYLRHKMHAGKNDGFRFRGGGTLRQPETVADIIREVLYVGFLIFFSRLTRDISSFSFWRSDTFISIHSKIKALLRS